MNNKVYQSFAEYFGDYFDLLNDENITIYRNIINQVISEKNFPIEYRDEEEFRKVLIDFVKTINKKIHGDEVREEIFPIINLCISCFMHHLFNKGGDGIRYYVFREKNIPASRPRYLLQNFPSEGSFQKENQKFKFLNKN